MSNMINEENAFILSLIGGILITIGSVMTLLLMPMYNDISANSVISSDTVSQEMVIDMMPIISSLGIVCGIIVIVGAFLINGAEYRKLGAVLVIIFSLLGIMGGGGFLIGSIIGIIGAIFAFKIK